MKVAGMTLSLIALPLFSLAAVASTAYGDLNNFDVVNDTGEECHGFEIEIEDLHSTDITYTFDWNHYGAPTISEDHSDPAHPRVRIRYQAKFNAATGKYAAYTAVPARPLAPTDGHTCTNVSVNEGCEHFGVGLRAAPTAVRYYWLVDSTGSGTLARGAPVNVATPVFNYLPPAGGQPARVVAVIEAPPPPEAEDPPPAFPDFGEAVWAKEIKTTSKNDQAVALEDLVSDDPDDPADRNWLNDKPNDGVVVDAEVEVEWRMMQTEFGQADGGANGQLAAAPEELPDGDENVTRRYEFFKYAGDLQSFDGESGEAMCDKVAPDGLHGVGTVRVTDPNGGSYDYDCGADIVVGDYIGAQMAGFDAEAGLGLIDNLQDGRINEAYVPRTLVVGGNTPYTIAITAGALPAGMALDLATGVLTGTPPTVGAYAFTLDVLDANGSRVTGNYALKVIDPAAPDPRAGHDAEHFAERRGHNGTGRLVYRQRRADLERGLGHADPVVDRLRCDDAESQYGRHHVHVQRNERAGHEHAVRHAEEGLDPAHGKGARQAWRQCRRLEQVGRDGDLQGHGLGLGHRFLQPASVLPEPGNGLRGVRYLHQQRRAGQSHGNGEQHRHRPDAADGRDRHARERRRVSARQCRDRQLRLWRHAVRCRELHRAHRRRRHDRYLDGTVRRIVRRHGKGRGRQLEEADIQVQRALRSDSPSAPVGVRPEFLAQLQWICQHARA